MVDTPARPPVRHRTRKPQPVTIEAPSTIAALASKVAQGAEVVLTVEGEPLMKLVPLQPVRTLNLPSDHLEKLLSETEAHAATTRPLQAEDDERPRSNHDDLYDENGLPR